MAARAPENPVSLTAYWTLAMRWLEADEPHVVEYKESRLPAAEASNALVRVPVRFAEDSLEEKLAAPRPRLRPARADVRGALLAPPRQGDPGARAEFGSSTDTPETLFHELGFRAVDRVSIFGGGSELGARGMPPRWILRLMPSMRDGYCVWTFEFGG